MPSKGLDVKTRMKSPRQNRPKHPKAGDAAEADFAQASVSCRKGGFSLIELMVVMFLLAILVVASLNTMKLLDRSSRRQALHTTALEIAQGKIEELQSTAYNPPVGPFGAGTSNLTTSVTLALDRAGTSTLVPATLNTVIAPVSKGHLVTVTVATTNSNQILSVQLQSLINRMSGGQP